MHRAFSSVALIFFAALVALPTLAVADDVRVFPVRGIDLSQFKTFKMLPTRVLTGTGVIENDPDVSPFINAAIRKELTQKGLKEVSENADMEVAPGALSVSIPQVETLVFNVSMDADWGTSPLMVIGRYNKEGTMVVNLIDPRVKKSIWLGIVKRATGRPQSRERDVNKATANLFKKYPPLK